MTEFAYDAFDRPTCTAVRMNPAGFGSAPVDGCTLRSAGSYGPDRITRTSYDNRDRVTQVDKAVGTGLAQVYAAYTYNQGDRPLTVTDANGNLAAMHYDGFERQDRWTFPSKTVAGQVNAADYEAYGYDLWYEGSSGLDRRSLLTNHQGSIVAVANASGNVVTINSYDPWGVPGGGNGGRFQYTGQAWIPELGMYYYKARIYWPALGRFLQTDPVGYEDQVNLYAYVGNDPLNMNDPTGECETIENKDGSVTHTGICGTSEKAAQYIEDRKKDSDSRIAQTDANAVAHGRLVLFTIGPKDAYGEDVDSAVTNEDVNGTITVAFDPLDQALANGKDAVTGAKVKDYVESMDEITEHEIAGHVNDIVNHVKGSAGAIRAENAYRERRGESFRRVGHGGKVIPGN